MQNSIQKFRQSSSVFKKPGILSENWKLWRASTTIDFNNFCLNFAHVPYLPRSTKRCAGFFLFCLELVLFVKIKKDLVYTHPPKPSLSITQDLNKIKKITEHIFVDIGKTKTYAKFQQKLVKSMVDGVCQSFQFFRQITWFIGNKRALSKFKYWILHHLISIIKLRNN